MLYQTHAKVHLSNIRDNILAIRKAVGENCKILIAVKANAYGHGAVEVSRMAARIGVDWLGVATVPEGIELRRANISLPILKFSPAFPEEMLDALQNNLTLSVCTYENALAINAVARSLSKKVFVHLKVDTGMGRIGVSEHEAPELALRIVRDCPYLDLQGIFTHLPVSDEANPDFTSSQLKLFKRVIADTEAKLGRKIEFVHCANSGGILGHKESWLSMVRPGIMIYGSYPDKDTPKTIPLKPGLSFCTRVSFIKKVEAGTTIGYGRTWKASESAYIATIPVGYADGFNRLFSNSGRVLINGRSYPIVGRVCMDQCMIHLGSQHDVRVGDEVVLIGKSGDEEISVDEWAQKLGTITYEVTCQINARVERIHEETAEDLRTTRWMQHSFE